MGCHGGAPTGAPLWRRKHRERLWGLGRVAHGSTWTGWQHAQAQRGHGAAGTGPRPTGVCGTVIPCEVEQDGYSMTSTAPWHIALPYVCTSASRSKGSTKGPSIKSAELAPMLPALVCRSWDCSTSATVPLQPPPPGLSLSLAPLRHWRLWLTRMQPVSGHRRMLGLHTKWQHRHTNNRARASNTAGHTPHACPTPVPDHKLERHHGDSLCWDQLHTSIVL